MPTGTRKAAPAACAAAGGPEITKRTREIPVYVGVFMNYDDEERWMIYRKDGRNFPGSKPYLVMDPWDPEVETPQI